MHTIGDRRSESRTVAAPSGLIRELGTALSGLASRSIDAWRARQEAKRLLELDDRVLHDIGLSRADVALALRTGRKA